MNGPGSVLRPSLPAGRDDLAGRRALVLGLARSGVAAVRYLADAGAEVTVYDRHGEDVLAEAITALDRRQVVLALAAEPDVVRALLADAELVVTSPSVSARFPTTEPWLREALVDAEAAGAAIVSEVDLFLRLTRARVCAVTGTKGKTTTASLIAAILEAAAVPHVLGGNIGTPLIEEADRLDPDTWAVLELSELQLPTISRGADVAVYTNIVADHLDRHGSVEAYRAVKGRLAELSAADGELILNREDPGCVALASRLPGSRIRWYGLAAHRGSEAWVEADRIVVAGEPVMDVADVPLPGEHMLRNVLAAALCGQRIGAGSSAMADAIRAFGGVPNRLEMVGERDGIRFVNDSQATIPIAAEAGIRAFPDGRVVIIAGGQGKGLGYAELAEAIVERCRAAVLIGETAAELEGLIASRLPVTRAGSMAEAVAAAVAAAEPGDVVLLAPAAASFDMFVDYEARGDAFRAAVATLPGSTTPSGTEPPA